MRSLFASLTLAAAFAASCNTAPSPSSSIIQVVKLEHVQASDLARTLGAFTGEHAGDHDLRVVADEASNALVLAGDKDDLGRMLELIARLDVPPEQPRDNLSVIYLKHVPANDMADTLNQLLAQDASATGSAAVVIESHSDSNSLLLRASGENQRQILALIDRLDVDRTRTARAELPRPAQDGEGTLTVVHLENTLADDLAEALQEFLAQDAAAQANKEKIDVRSHEPSNSLLIRAPKKQYQQLLELIERLDVEMPK